MRAKRPKKTAAAVELERLALVDAAFGMFKSLPTSSDEFARQKANEIKLEEHRHRPKQK